MTPSLKKFPHESVHTENSWEQASSARVTSQSPDVTESDSEGISCARCGSNDRVLTGADGDALCKRAPGRARRGAAEQGPTREGTTDDVRTWFRLDRFDRPGDADRLQDVRESIRMLAELVRDHDRLVKVLLDMHRGYPAGGHEGSSGSGGDGTDRMVNLAIGNDEARKDLGRLDRLSKQARGVAEELDGIRQQWLKTTHDKPTGQAEPGCRSCARLPKSWSPRRRLPDDPTKVDHAGKPIVQFAERCQWCDDWFRAEEADPPLPILRLHKQGVRITESVLRRYGIKTTRTARERRLKKAG
jgi:hypothetical protein